jgi:hypothetical protein
MDLAVAAKLVGLLHDRPRRFFRLVVLGRPAE